MTVQLTRAAAGAFFLRRGMIRFLTIAFVTAQLGSMAARAEIVYGVDTTITSSDPTGNPLQEDTVSGSITTDGMIGILSSGDILGWNLQLIDTLNAADDFTLTTANSSVVEDTGSALSATATGLSFNFGGSGEFLIQANSPGPFSGSHYFCFSTGGACLTGETIAPLFIYTDGVVLTGAAAPVGMQPLNAVPEPALWPLAAAGLLLIGFHRRLALRRR